MQIMGILDLPGRPRASCLRATRTSSLPSRVVGGIPEPLVDIEYLCGVLLTSLSRRAKQGAASQRFPKSSLRAWRSPKPLLPFEDSAEHVEILDVARLKKDTAPKKAAPSQGVAGK